MKQRRFVSVANFPGLARVEVLNEETGKWESPKYGKRFRARKRLAPGEKQSEKFCDSREEAVRWLREANSSSANTKNSAGSLPTLSEVWEIFLKRRASQMRPSTTARYRTMIRLYFYPLMAVQIDAITPSAVDRWLEALKDESAPNGPTKKRLRFKHELDLLRTLFNHFIEYADDDQIVHNPVRRRHYRDGEYREKTDATSKDLTPRELTLLVEQLRKMKLGSVLAPMACLQFHHALRISEAAGVHFEDIVLNFESPADSRLTVRRHVLFRHREGMADEIRAGYKNSKGGNGMKESRMFPEVFYELARVWKRDKVGLMFTDESGRNLRYKQIYNAYNAAFRAAGLQYKATHVLRHGGARTVLNKSKDLTMSQQQLGNASMAATQVYAQRAQHAFDDFVLKEWESFDTEGQARGKSDS